MTRIRNATAAAIGCAGGGDGSGSSDGRGTVTLWTNAMEGRGAQHSTDTAKVLAFTSLAMLPALVFLSVFEKRIVGGLTGAVKG